MEKIKIIKNSVKHRNGILTQIENCKSSDIILIQKIINEIEYKRMLPSVVFYSNRLRISTRFGEYDKIVYFKENCLLEALKKAQEEFIFWYQQKQQIRFSNTISNFKNVNP